LGRLFQKAFDYKVSRRSFIKGSAVTAAGIGLLGKGSGLNKVSDAFAQEVTEKEGKWITAPCWHDCGGRNLNKVYVVDGIVKDHKTDDSPDSPNCPQYRACIRGYAIKQEVLGPDRLKYPMKRKNWEPGGGKKELRGRDEWVRISWDEALDIVASETARIRKTYGNEAVLAGNIATTYEMDRLMNLLGGSSAMWGSYSRGTWQDTAPHIGVMKYTGSGGNFLENENMMINDRLDIRNSDLIVMWGPNPAWNSVGGPMYALLQAKKAGAKFIFVDPVYSYSAQVLADEWIPCRVGTDTPFLLGVMHTIITEDDPVNNPLIDWDIVKRCTIGFDKDSMPEGADPKDNFKDYVMGTYDGVPKSAEWASEICGVPPEKIRHLAREIGSTEKVALFSSRGPARVSNADSYPWAFFTLAFLTGNIGQSGKMCGNVLHFYGANGGPGLVGVVKDIMPPSNNVPPIPNPLWPTNHPKYTIAGKPPSGSVINRNEIWDAVLTGKYTYAPGDIRDINIQMIYNAGPHNSLNQNLGALKGVKAYRNVEFVFSTGFVLSTVCKYADVVLPITTKWEQYGGPNSTSRDAMLFYGQVLDQPLFEAKDEDWIAREIAKKLNVDPDKVMPYSAKQRVFNQYTNAVVVKDNGVDYEKLVAITQEDIDEMGVEGKPQEGKVPLKELLEKGIYQVPRSPGDNFGYIAYKDFIEDPEKNPLGSESGKFEIYCKPLADFIYWCSGDKYPSIPAYVKPVEGYEDTFADWDNKVKGEFPFQLLSVHHLMHAHSNFANVRWIQEAFPSVYWINAEDAKNLGIKSGDTLLITSSHGRVLTRAYVTERIMPGVVMTYEGHWIDYDDELDLDRGGSANVLSAGKLRSQGHSAYNSTIIKIEKWEGQPLETDSKRPQRIIF
jgi:anaerobic dimethyl sulfoxide reductase subunit A